MTKENVYHRPARKESFVPFVFLLLIIAISSRAQPSANRNEIMQLTKKANDHSLEGYVKKDARQIVSVYTKGALLFPPGGKVISGNNEILKYYQDALEGDGRSVKIDTNTISFDVIDDNNAVQSGSYTIYYKATPSSEVSEIKGTMLIVWKKIDGYGRLTRTCGIDKTSLKTQLESIPHFAQSGDQVTGSFLLLYC